MRNASTLLQALPVLPERAQPQALVQGPVRGPLSEPAFALLPSCSQPLQTIKSRRKAVK
jgi:hypothetical protein